MAPVVVLPEIRHGTPETATALSMVSEIPDSIRRGRLNSERDRTHHGIFTLRHICRSNTYLTTSVVDYICMYSVELTQDAALHSVVLYISVAVLP